MLSRIMAAIERDDPDDIRIVVERAEKNGDDMILQIAWDESGEARQQACIQCRGVPHHNLSLGYADRLELVADHVVLWPFTEPREQLYFYGPRENADTVLGALMREHKRAAGEYLDFWACFNDSLVSDYFDILSAPSGVLATGPAPLIRAYARALESVGMRHSVLELGPAKHWNGRDWVENAMPLHALFLGDSLVIAEDFVETARL
ncbi:MAG: hypothetical protein ACKVW3_14920 [Phycisphaerales bacterium]